MNSYFCLSFIEYRVFIFNEDEAVILNLKVSCDGIETGSSTDCGSDFVSKLLSDEFDISIYCSHENTEQKQYAYFLLF